MTLNETLKELFSGVNLQRIDNSCIFFYALSQEWKDKILNCDDLKDQKVVFLEAPTTAEVCTSIFKMQPGRIKQVDATAPIYLWAALVSPPFDKVNCELSLRAYNVGYSSDKVTIPYVTEGYESIQEKVYSKEVLEKLKKQKK